MKPSQRAYEERRAQKVSKALEQWIEDKYYVDPLPDAITACDAFDGKLRTLPDLTETDPLASMMPDAGGSVAASVSSEATIEIPDDEDNPFDETDTAVDSIDQWSGEREIRRKRIVFLMTGE